MGKGADFERRVAKHLSLWWTGGKHDDTIWRTSQSGGRATVRRRQGKRTSGQAGDLCSTDPASRGLFRLFAFELKVGYHQVTINDLIDRPPGFAFKKDGWDGWVEQAKAARLEAGAACWMIIHHRNRASGGKQPMVYFPTKLFPVLLWPVLQAGPMLTIDGVIRVSETAAEYAPIRLTGCRFADLFGKLDSPSGNPDFLAAAKAVAKKRLKER